MPNPSTARIEIRNSFALLLGVACLATFPTALPVGAEEQEATVKLEQVEVDASAIQLKSALVPVITTPETVEPVSTLGRNFIDNVIAPTDDYSEIMNFSPSVATVATGLPGSQESSTISIRGFQDGQYNVMFDGIPFGDTNDFTHHSNDYFTPMMLESVAVDRGPGSAATIGEATFGGTVALTSRALADSEALTLSETVGNFGTKESELTLQTGKLGADGNTRAYFAFDHEENNGWATLTGLRRTDYLFKIETDLTKSVSATAAFTYSDPFYYTNGGATAAQIAQYGYQFGLNNNRQSQAYYAWNYQPKTTDMEYILLKASGGSLQVSDQAYSYSYLNITQAGLDLSGETPNGTVLGTALSGPGNNDVPGVIQPFNQYRAIGNVLRIEDTFADFTLKAGLWTEYQNNTRQGHNVDFTLGGAYDELPGTSTALNYYMRNHITTYQPYVVLEWKPLSGLTIAPGVKYNSFGRNIDAAVNQGTGLPLSYSKTYTETTPSLNVNYTVNNDVALYAQAAKGFLAPNLNIFYVNDPSQNQASPETTTNYQAGVGYAHGPFSWSLDGYYIDFNNLIGKRTVGQNTIFFNEGGVDYKGVELEASAVLGTGLSVYANGSINSATNKANGQEIPESPKRTASMGLLYSHKGASASIVTKYIGNRYGDTGETIPIGGYTISTFSAGYTFFDPLPWVKKAEVRASVDNLFNKQGIDDLYGYTPINNLPIYWTIPGRSYYLTVKLTF